MKISAINSNTQNNPSFQKGLYFTKTSTVMFDKSKSLNCWAREHISTSSDGFKYLENKSASKSLKETIANIPFVKDLAERFDTFVYLRKPFRSPYFGKNYSPLKIQWFDESKGAVQSVEVLGKDGFSNDKAVKNMINNLETQNFF